MFSTIKNWFSPTPPTNEFIGELKNVGFLYEIMVCKDPQRSYTRYVIKEMYFPHQQLFVNNQTIFERDLNDNKRNIRMEGCKEKELITISDEFADYLCDLRTILKQKKELEKKIKSSDDYGKLMEDTKTDLKDYQFHQFYSLSHEKR